MIIEFISNGEINSENIDNFKFSHLLPLKKLSINFEESQIKELGINKICS